LHGIVSREVELPVRRHIGRDFLYFVADRFLDFHSLSPEQCSHRDIASTLAVANREGNIAIIPASAPDFFTVSGDS
jgi:hypothetical protein